MKLRRFIPLALVLILALSLFGCSAAAPAKEALDEFYLETPARSNGSYYGYADEAAVEYETAAPQEAGNNVQSVTTNRKLIRTVSLRVETEDCQALVSRITADVTGLGGYLERSEVSQGRYASASMTIRVPSSRLNEFLALVEDASNVTWHSEDTRDVTLQYSDTESHIKALRTEQDRLTELLTEAADLTELLELEDRLTEVRYQLESYESQLRTLDSLIDYSTVTLEIDQVEVFTQVEEPGFWQKLGSDFTESLAALGRFFSNLFAWFVVALPWLAVFLGIPALVIIIIVAAARKRRKAKREAEKAAE